MKHYIFVFCVLGTSILHGQSKIYQYGYDPSGNRDNRQVICRPPCEEGAGHSGESRAVVDPSIYATHESKKKASQELQSEKVSIFPNPVDRVVQINFDEQEVHTTEVRILDAHGKILFREEDIDGDFELPFEGYAPGNYFIWLRFADKIERFQVVKR